MAEEQSLDLSVKGSSFGSSSSPPSFHLLPAQLLASSQGALTFMVGFVPFLHDIYLEFLFPDSDPISGSDFLIRQKMGSDAKFQSCGSASFLCRSGSEFPSGCRSRLTSMRRCRSTCGSYPNFYTCWKIGAKYFYFYSMPVYNVFSF